jgi:trk system potassium uptake protein TrkH
MVLLMIVGGSSFSTSGGIKIIRFIITLKSIPWVTRKLSLPAKAITPLKIGDKALFEKDVIIAFLMIGLGILSIFISSLIFTLYGYSFIDSIFEISSAFGTAGMSTGITGMNLPDPLKLILNLEMVIGRVEIIPFLIFLKKIINR